MTAFAEQWGRPLEKAGYTQISNLLLRRWREIGLSRTQRDNLLIIISYQSNHETIPSAKRLAYESGVCYETTRKNLKTLFAFKKDGGKGLMIPVVLKGGRIRYNMMPLRRVLEKLEKEPLEIVKHGPNVRPAPKPAPIVTLPAEKGALAEMTSKVEPDEDAIADWEEIKGYIREEVSDAAYKTWIEPTRGWYRDSSEVLHIYVPSSAHESMLMNRFKDVIDRCRKFYGIASIACKVLLLAASLGGV